ncbi:MULTISPECIES: hypothetical protein [unclassified Paracoccus (in: a-proteobacteria)]|uniref:hypothetical protein n=1 Tax=unclassified Paracoccus (in: a-proteobacteria) TaxID=2688777 RepID=UPI001602A585|nr:MULTISPECIES: hypothetical protein [unclassified Paracoccus (in: a-proteobacteria)]MBB1491814.1 hypothetical protein [Paracoccus sp. MC1854]MBB1496910.1 hypothetical protein [Paracoccus sp. MC1862]QQO45531.1 hypothetical protein JGR78_04060 [Paracoccus sp. MC1862]
MRHLVLLAMLLATSAHASTEEAWAEMRADVATKCRALLPEGAAATIEVNPFGSERFAAALVTLQAEERVERVICIYEKQTGVTELTTPFD